MRRATLSTATAILLAMAAPLTAAPAPAEEGTWTATEKNGAQIQLTLQWKSSTWGRSFARSEMRGISEREIRSVASTPVSFRIERDAGVFHLEGSFKEGRGAGHFRFDPSRQFASTLRSLGIEGANQVTDRDLMFLALANASAAMVREFTTLGLGPLRVEDLIELAIHNVTPDYVRTMRSLGISGTNTVSGVVQMRIHRITAEYVRELETLGYRDLSRDQLLQMGIHGVSAAFIREVREAGFRDLSPETLLQMKIHGIDAKFVREATRRGR